MSGPKTSRYTLTPEQRRILEEQRKIQKRKAVALQTINKSKKRLLEIHGNLSAQSKTATELVNMGMADGGFSKKYGRLSTIVASISEVIPKNGMESEVEEIESAAEQLTSSLDEAEKISTELDEISKQNSGSLKSNIERAVDTGFTLSFSDVENPNRPLNELKSKLLSQIGEMKASAILPKEYKDKLEEAEKRVIEINELSFLKNYSALSVAPLIKSCRGFIEDYEACHLEFEELYTQYAALCSLYHYVVVEYPCTPQSVNALKEEINRIEKAADEEDEQAYISRCLDEVMEEMGYNVIGSREVTKKSGKRFKSRLFSYGEGTAVNVTYSSDGRIAMEIGGVDTEDREPDENETNYLCRSMEGFCHDFKEIEKRLLARGVILASRISMNPPTAENAQIINTEDYHMTDEVRKLRVSGKNKTANKPKTMKME